MDSVENNIEIRNFQENNEYYHNIFTNLNAERKLGTFCDFTIKSEDGGSIPVHKIVLISTNPFYKKLFNVGFADGRKDFHVIKGVSLENLEKIVDYIYIGRIQLTPDVAKEILDTVIFLGMRNLGEFCLEFIKETINYENCLDLWRCSTSYENLIENSLKEECMKFILQNIDVFLETILFLENINSDEMEELLLHDRLGCSEEKLLSLIVKWTTLNIDERGSFIRNFMKKINFEDISLEFLTSCIFEQNTLENNHNFLLSIFDIFKSNVKIQISQGLGMKSVKYSVPDIFALIGNEIVHYDTINRKFTTTVTKMREPRSRIAISTFGKGKNIFICGGKQNSTRFKLCEYYSMNENQWKCLPPMSKSRCEHNAVNFNDKIYVCGGDNEYLEIFDIEKTIWLMGPKMLHLMNEFGFFTLNNCLYAIHTTNIIERLDLRQGGWTNLNVPGNLRVNIYQASGTNNLIHSFGKTDSYMFDIRNNKWLDDVKTYTVPYEQPPKLCCSKDVVYLCAQEYYDESEYGKYLMQTFERSNLIQNNFTSISFASNHRVEGLFCL